MNTSSLHRLPNLICPILGHTEIISADGGTHDTLPLKEAWGLRSGVYTPMQLVAGFAPLLNTVVFHLGDDPIGRKLARSRLLDNIAANLATDTRESTLRLNEPLDISRREIKDQATRIGKTLVKWARESEKSDDGKLVHVDLHLRSPCEGHLLTPSNVDLMFGDRSQPQLMQLFNEYMHQMVLLRDALLPFQNYQDVLIPVGRRSRGIRHLESARSLFLADLLTRHTTQRNVVNFAKALLSPDLVHSESVGYGFQYAHGTILPALLSGGPTPLHLLQYVPVRVNQDVKDVIFDYQFDDYYSAPRTEIPFGVETAASEVLRFPEEAQVGHNASLAFVDGSKVGKPSRLELRLETVNEICIAVDVGQISRGHRYSYLAKDSFIDTKAEDNASSNASTTKASSFIITHDAMSILQTTDPGLISAKNGGFHIIPAESPLIALAVLGKLYPENVVLLPKGQEINLAHKAGKEFEPKFVIWGGVQQGGLKGSF
ncbi:hypothetical protein PENSTE_c018G03625 [Penicillium steckii]|uniref:Uncharacterized protein n=1 Tax=Penicillium steckii TaxID=303698 RepID=A0A1V6SW81_9EURO|nr:hypothetical protein PENSTE_c018G03625 [Penicillium steckii]